jgi:hypothetical protein
VSVCVVLCNSKKTNPPRHLRAPTPGVVAAPWGSSPASSSRRCCAQLEGRCQACCVVASATVELGLLYLFWKMDRSCNYKATKNQNSPLRWFKSSNTSTRFVLFIFLSINLWNGCHYFFNNIFSSIFFGSVVIFRQHFLKCCQHFSSTFFRSVSNIFSRQHFSEVLPTSFFNIFRKCCQHFFVNIFRSVAYIFSLIFFRSVTNIFSCQHFSEVCQHFFSSTLFESVVNIVFQHFPKVLLKFFLNIFRKRV